MEMHQPSHATVKPTGIILRDLGIDAPLVIDHAASPRTAQTHVAAQDVVDELAELLAAELFVEAEDVDPDRSFVEMGLDSILAVEWIQAGGHAVRAVRVDDPHLRAPDPQAIRSPCGLQRT